MALIQEAQDWTFAGWELGLGTDALSLTFLLVTKETSAPLLLPWKPPKLSLSVSLSLSPSPWRHPAGKQLPWWDELPGEGEERSASRPAFAAGEAAARRSSKGEIPTPPKNVGHPWSRAAILCQSQHGMALGKHGAEDSGFQFIPGGCFSFRQPLSRSKEISKFLYLANAENLPGQVFSLSNFASNPLDGIG